MSGDVLICRKMCICLSSFVRPGSWSVATGDDSILIPSGSLTTTFFDIMTGSIVGVNSFYRWMFAPKYKMDSVYFIGELGGVPILLTKLILGVLILNFIHYRP